MREVLLRNLAVPILAIAAALATRIQRGRIGPLMGSRAGRLITGIPPGKRRLFTLAHGTSQALCWLS